MNFENKIILGDKISNHELTAVIQDHGQQPLKINCIGWWEASNTFILLLRGHSKVEVIRTVDCSVMFVLPSG